jgi:hypothetical protein
LAIGYDEIAWDSEIVDVPQWKFGAEGSEYKEWKSKSFLVDISLKGNDIVKHFGLIIHLLAGLRSDRILIFWKI